MRQQLTGLIPSFIAPRCHGIPQSVGPETLLARSIADRFHDGYSVGEIADHELVSLEDVEQTIRDFVDVRNIADLEHKIEELQNKLDDANADLQTTKDELAQAEESRSRHAKVADAWYETLAKIVKLTREGQTIALSSAEREVRLPQLYKLVNQICDAAMNAMEE